MNGTSFVFMTSFQVFFCALSHLSIAVHQNATSLFLTSDGKFTRSLFIFPFHKNQQPVWLHLSSNFTSLSRLEATYTFYIVCKKISSKEFNSVLENPKHSRKKLNLVLSKAHPAAGFNSQIFYTKNGKQKNVKAFVLCIFYTFLILFLI